MPNIRERFGGAAKKPDFSRLINSLNNAGISEKNNALYQVIKDLIGNADQLQTTIVESIEEVITITQNITITTIGDFYSAELAAKCIDETGTAGHLVFSTAPTFETSITVSGFVEAIIGTANSGLAVFATSYSDTAAFGGIFLGRHARDTAASPDALQSGDILGGFFAQGHDGTAFGPTNVGAIRFVAAENYTTIAKGTDLEFATTPIGSVTRATRWTIRSTGHLVASAGTEQIRWGETNSFPGLKRSTTILQVRLGDDSDYAPLETKYVQISAGDAFLWVGRAQLRSPADGIITLFNAANTDFTRLNFGGASSAFPTIARSGAELQIRLADASADADIKASHIRTSATDFMHVTTAALANGAAAALGTLTNAPVAGDPTKWIPINDNGTTRYIPAW